MIRRLLVWFVTLYQAVPRGRPPVCRFHPTCSSYALEALQNHGAARGSWLTAKRIARCQPFGSWGFDPVPPVQRIMER